MPPFYMDTSLETYQQSLFVSCLINNSLPCARPEATSVVLSNVSRITKWSFSTICWEFFPEFEHHGTNSCRYLYWNTIFSNRPISSINAVCCKWLLWNYAKLVPCFLKLASYKRKHWRLLVDFLNIKLLILILLKLFENFIGVQFINRSVVT